MYMGRQNQLQPPTADIMTDFTSPLAEAEVLLAPTRTAPNTSPRTDVVQDCQGSATRFEDTHLDYPGR
jgi:hypothetical protein